MPSDAPTAKLSVDEEMASSEGIQKIEDDLEIGLNDIGRISLKTSAPLLFDSYRKNRITGSFILVDPQTNATVAAGMIV